MSRQHPRQARREGARRDLPGHLWSLQDQLHLPYAAMMQLLGQYIDFRLRVHQGLAPTAENMIRLGEIDDVVSRCANFHRLTFSEIVLILTEHQLRIAEYMTREEHSK